MKRVALFALMLAAGCTDQIRAKSFGGEMTTRLPPGHKLVNVTWKAADLWILTRPMKPGDEAESYDFRESSSWGLVEGKISIIETQKPGWVK